ncbi:MAG: family 43 glycosylhydrolase [Tannerella sp.]|nr:family 43 glycosylhydrolase [Tannerella sp.]
MFPKIIATCCLLLATSFLRGQNIDNPVLPRVADAGVMKYNGRYYIGGVFTLGDFYVSKDLTHWEGPIHAVTMDNHWATPYGIGNEQIHANDLHYINGVFHLYWSVNHWSKERNVIHISHATADSPLGPYVEPDKTQWFENRIDAHLFQDDDGKFYFYMVKFTDGNTIWVRPMKDPATFDGEAQYIFASQPNSWETLDNRVAEGPWVIKYRDRYYLMYNANHTSPRYGNYALGVAEAASPLEFNHGNKYPHPVVKSNQPEGEETAGDLLFTPGQPNILRGPNGFEWWLIYMANRNKEPRGQYINRIHFFGNKLTVDGITDKNTPGYHPVPSLPTYQYFSDNNQTLPAVNQPIPSIPAAHYYFEAGIKTSGSADGIIAWQADENNWLRITLDSPAKKWRYTLKNREKEETKAFSLPSDFKANVYHTVAVFKNHSTFKVLIDNIPAPQQSVIETDFTAKGLPGIYSDNQNAEFEGITYTIGWDEYGENIAGWETSATENGLRTKGDLLDSYELSMQVSALSDNSLSSIYPVYIDRENYLQTDFDFEKRQFSVSGKIKGKNIYNQRFELSDWQEYYVNNVYSDFMERHFVFDDSITLDAVLLPQTSLLQSDSIFVFYRKNGELQPLIPQEKTERKNPAATEIRFPPVKTNELVFTKQNDRDISLQKIKVHELVKPTYNLHVAKDSEIVRIFVAGKPVCEIQASFGASQVGLRTDKADFITLFHTQK